MPSPMSRRRFLRTGTISVAAAAAAVAAAPSLPGLLGDAEADAPGVGTSTAGSLAAAGGTAGGEAGIMASPVTAHISDLSGEMSLFVDNRTVVVRDPALVARILAAAR